MLDVDLTDYHQKGMRSENNGSVPYDVWQRPMEAPKSGRLRPPVAQFPSPGKHGKFPKDSPRCDRLCVMARPVPTAIAALFILNSAALGQNVPSPGDRFALYNVCAPMGLVIESLPDDVAGTGLAAAQLRALAESRLRTIGLHESDASTFLHVAASRDAVQLQFMKPVIDVASSEPETIPTFSKSAVVRDGTAAGVMLELSKLLDLFLAEYQRVNEPDCARTNPARRADRERTAALPSGEAAKRGGPAVNEPPLVTSDSPGTEPPRGQGDVRRGGTSLVPGPDDFESRVHSVGGGVTSPQLIRKVEPSYSEAALNAKLEGSVMLAIEVWEDGKAHNIHVLSGVGMGLDEKAIEAVEQWVFKPGTKNGQPVKVLAQVQVTFKLVVKPRRP